MIVIIVISSDVINYTELYSTMELKQLIKNPTKITSKMWKVVHAGIIETSLSDL